MQTAEGHVKSRRKCKTAERLKTVESAKKEERDKSMRGIKEFIEEEDGVGVVEIILILVDN